jgi:hypothetical protein
VVLQPAAITQLDIRTDDAIRADVAVLSNFGGRIDDGGGMDHEKLTNVK